MALKALTMDAVPLAERNEALQAFQAEAHLLAQLDHPGLTKVTDFFSEGGCWYLVMECGGRHAGRPGPRPGGPSGRSRSKKLDAATVRCLGVFA